MRKPEEMQAAAGGASPQTPMVIGIGASAGGWRHCSSSSAACLPTAA